MTDENENPIDELELDASETDEPEHGHDDEDDKTAKVDSELEEAETDEAREEIRARRRNERKSRGQRNRERVEALERNLQAVIEQNRTLQSQVASIQDINTSSQLAQVDQAIQQAHQSAEHFKGVIANAAQRQDGRTLAEATEYMIAARTRAQQLTNLKESAVRAANAPKPLDTRSTTRAQQFLGKNTWYGGPTSADLDSKVMTAIDNGLTAEGWDPTSDEYWAELENRAKKYLPHRAASSAPAARRGSPVSGGSGSQSSAGAGASYTLSPDRVQAIKAAGMWDDPAARAKMIKTYRDYDKQHRS